MGKTPETKTEITDHFIQGWVTWKSKDRPAQEEPRYICTRV